jgi:protein gp37
MREIRKAIKQMAPHLDFAISCGNSDAVAAIAHKLAVVINVWLELIPPPHQKRFRAQAVRWIDKLADDRGEPNTKQAGDTSS